MYLRQLSVTKFPFHMILLTNIINGVRNYLYRRFSTLLLCINWSNIIIIFSRRFLGDVIKIKVLKRINAALLRGRLWKYVPSSDFSLC